jgi:hypothetical protein
MGDIETVRNYVAWRRNPGVTGDTIVTDALARVLAVADVAVRLQKNSAAMLHTKTDAEFDPLALESSALLTELDTAVAALRGATEVGA